MTLDKNFKQALIALMKAAGQPPEKIAKMLAIAGDNEPVTKGGVQPILVNQADAARLISGSRFLVRQLVKDGKLRQIFLTPTLIRYSRAELDTIAGGGK